MKAAIVEREFAGATFEPLRYQILVPETRAEQTPVFDGRVIVGHRDTPERVQVLRLIGFGASPQTAKAMAARAGVRV